MQVGYSRISDAQQQALSDPLAVAKHELEKAGADLVLLDVGSGRSDTARPQFRKLRELILDRKATEVICPSQDRLGRNTELILQFVQLCQMQGVPIRDLNGRELEIKTADGKLMTTIVAALDTHRSDLYSEKVRRHLSAAREQGFPAVPSIPFGLKKVRNEAGRFVSLDIDPVTGPIARQRVDWYLKDGLSQTGLFHRIRDRHPEHPMSHRHLGRWLASPLLTGRLRWNDKACTEQSFPALISDAKHEAIKIKLSASSTNSGLRGRQVRLLTGLVKCADCGTGLTYKIFPGREYQYLRCSNAACGVYGKRVKVDQVFGVLQYSLSEHAKALVPILQRPKTDSPEVTSLQQEIEVLRTVSGTDDVIEKKQLEINQLRRLDHETPSWLLVGLMRQPLFWVAEDAKLNQVLRLLLERVEVHLGAGVKQSRVVEVRARTTPAVCPLPKDQRNIKMLRGLDDVLVAAEHQEALKAAMNTLTCR